MIEERNAGEEDAFSRTTRIEHRQHESAEINCGCVVTDTRLTNDKFHLQVIGLSCASLMYFGIET